MIESYPCDFEFTTELELPEFDYGCDVRTNLLHKKMHELQVYSFGHGYEDYIVEMVIEKDNVEIWRLGS